MTLLTPHCYGAARRARRHLPLACLGWIALALAGCQFVPESQFQAVESQNRNLLEQNRAHLAEIENLKIHAREVEDQLIRAEEELARSDDRSRGRLADARPSRSGLTGGIPASLSDSLARLAERHSALVYDPASGLSKFDTDVLFPSGEATLLPEADRMLGELAAIFQAPEARDLKLMVVGHTDARGIKGREIRSKHPDNWHLSAARALAVVERLRRAGIPDERMGIAGYAGHQPISPNDTADSRQLNRRVEIFVVGPETPIIGWTETMGDSVYRR